MMSEPAAATGETLSKGNSVFIPAGKKLTFDGFFTAYAASVPDVDPG
jgi:hypothetical protein